MAAIEDVETQKRGVVIVFFHYQFDFHGFGLRELLKHMQGFPVKYMGIHYCCSEESMPFLLPFQNMIQYITGSDGRKHFRPHRGKITLYTRQMCVLTFLWNDSTTNPLLLYTYTIRCIPRLDSGN